MPLKFCPSPPPPIVRFVNVAVALGDSHTFNAVYLPSVDDFHPHLNETALRAQGCRVSFRNYGHSGATTDEMLGMAALLPAVAAPALAVIYGGVNDGSGGGPNTQANLVAIGQALQTAGYSRLVIGLCHYYNFTSGGDTLATPLAANATLRTKQQNAATTLGAAVADFYTFMRDLIVAGTDTQGSASWHVAPTDAHLNAYGQTILANCVVAAIGAAGWIDDLS